MKAKQASVPPLANANCLTSSEELRKYPMVTERLTMYAGPQCFPHLDEKSADYRVHANDFAYEDADVVDADCATKSVSGSSFLDSQNW